MRELRNRDIDPERHERIHFHLGIPGDDYPSDGIETLWARRENDELIIDSIPHYVRGVSYNDAVMADSVDGKLVFKDVIRSGGHSTVRVTLINPHDKERVLNSLHRLGCATEVSSYESLIAVDIPPDVDVTPIREYLDNGSLVYDVFKYEKANIVWEPSPEEKFIAALVEQVPELRPIYDKHISDCDELIPHPFFGELTRYVVRLLREGTPDAIKIVARILGVLEEGMASGGNDVEELISVSFLENAVKSPDVMLALEELIGPHLAKELSHYKE